MTKALLALLLIVGVAAGQSDYIRVPYGDSLTAVGTNNLKIYSAFTQARSFTFGGDSASLTLTFADSLYISGDLPMTEGAKKFIDFIRQYYESDERNWDLWRKKP